MLWNICRNSMKSPLIIVLDTDDIVKLGCADLDKPHILNGSHAVFSSRFVFDYIAGFENYRFHLPVVILPLDLKNAGIDINVFMLFYMKL